MYFKLHIPYIGPFSIVTQRRIKKLISTFCTDLDIKLLFTLFKIRSLFAVKDPIPKNLRSRVIYEFSCSGCSACYVGQETNRHLRVKHPASRTFSYGKYALYRVIRIKANGDKRGSARRVRVKVRLSSPERTEYRLGSLINSKAH